MLSHYGMPIENRKSAVDFGRMMAGQSRFARLKNRKFSVPSGVAAVASAAISGASVTTAPATAAIATVTSAAASSSSAAIFVTAAAPAPAAEAALLAGPGFVDTKGTALDLFAVELADGVLCIGFGSHGDKGESAGFARELVLHEQHFGHSAGLRKHILQLELRRRERKVAYVQSISHI
jgi:hypothetical protein